MLIVGDLSSFLMEVKMHSLIRALVAGVLSVTFCETSLVSPNPERPPGPLYADLKIDFRQRLSLSLLAKLTDCRPNASVQPTVSLTFVRLGLKIAEDKMINRFRTTSW